MLFAMSIITVQLGQCGNQIGGQLFHTFMEDVHSKPLATQVSARQLTEVFGCRSSPEAFSAEQVLASAYQNFCCRYTEFCRELKSTGPAEHTSESGNRSIYLQIKFSNACPYIKCTYCVTLYTLGWSKKSESDFFWLL